jgi:beta-lactamase superfamily II metal-dependent hydrolase
MKIRFLKAFNGDSIHISFLDGENKKRNILIDGGINQTYKLDKGKKGKPVFGELKNTIDNVKNSNELIDLLIMTHIDDDHISGILKWFSEDVDAFKLINEVWFNSGELIAKWLNKDESENLKIFFSSSANLLTSISQGKEFGKYISEKGLVKEGLILQNMALKRFGLEFKILSPNKFKLKKLYKDWIKEDEALLTAASVNDYSISLKDHLINDLFQEDDSCSNGSSIAFLLTMREKNLVFLGDSHPSVIVEGLKLLGYSEKKPLKADILKISHHGSKGNTNIELLKHIKAKNYVISTNGLRHEHPHKQFLARLMNENKDCSIYFNYEERMKAIFSKQDKRDYPHVNLIPIKKEFEL